MGIYKLICAVLIPRASGSDGQTERPEVSRKQDRWRDPPPESTPVIPEHPSPPAPRLWRVQGHCARGRFSEAFNGSH